MVDRVSHGDVNNGSKAKILSGGSHIASVLMLQGFTQASFKLEELAVFMQDHKKT